MPVGQGTSEKTSRECAAETQTSTTDAIAIAVMRWSPARATEKPRLDFGIRWIAQPDRQERFREVITRDRSLVRAVDAHLDAGARLANEDELLPRFDIAHPPVERRDAALQCRQLSFGVLFEAFVPSLAQIV